MNPISVYMSERQQLALALRESQQQNNDDNTSPIDAIPSSKSPRKSKDNQKSKTANKKKEKHSFGAPHPLCKPSDYETWTSERKSHWKSLRTNPNMYYYWYPPPLIDKKTGPWSHDENARLLGIIELRGLNYNWGFISMHIPGRIGYECKQQFCRLIAGTELEAQLLEDYGIPSLDRLDSIYFDKPNRSHIRPPADLMTEYNTAVHSMSSHIPSGRPSLTGHPITPPHHSPADMNNTQDNASGNPVIIATDQPQPPIITSSATAYPTEAVVDDALNVDMSAMPGNPPPSSIIIPSPPKSDDEVTTGSDTGYQTGGPQHGTDDISKATALGLSITATDADTAATDIYGNITKEEVIHHPSVLSTDDTISFSHSSHYSSSRLGMSSVSSTTLEDAFDNNAFQTLSGQHTQPSIVFSDNQAEHYKPSSTDHPTTLGDRHHNQEDDSVHQSRIETYSNQQSSSLGKLSERKSRRQSARLAEINELEHSMDDSTIDNSMSSHSPSMTTNSDTTPTPSSLHDTTKLNPNKRARSSRHTRHSHTDNSSHLIKLSHDSPFISAYQHSNPMVTTTTTTATDTVPNNSIVSSTLSTPQHEQGRPIPTHGADYHVQQHYRHHESRYLPQQSLAYTPPSGLPNPLVYLPRNMLSRIDLTKLYTTLDF